MNLQDYKMMNIYNGQTGRKSLDINTFLNLPDLNFYTFCKESYGINRGIYNAIDQWFYEHGLVNIHNRRMFLLSFVKLINEGNLNQNQHRMFKFGPGGLTKELEDFFHNCVSNPEI